MSSWGLRSCILGSGKRNEFVRSAQRLLMKVPKGIEDRHDLVAGVCVAILQRPNEVAAHVCGGGKPGHAQSDVLA